MDRKTQTVDAIVSASRHYELDKIEQRDNFKTIQIEKIKLSSVSQITLPNQPISKIIESFTNYDNK